MKRILLIILLSIPALAFSQVSGRYNFPQPYIVSGSLPDHSDLIGQWDFDEASGTYFDNHGSDDGTPANVIYGATGKINDAGDFEKDNDAYVTITGTNFGAGDAAMCMWVNIEALGSTMYVVGGDVGALGWTILSDGRMSILENGGSGSGTTTMTVPTGTLTFIAFVYDKGANSVKFWIDDQTEIESFSNASFDSETNTIGARLTTAFSFDGIIDEPYMYGAAVSDAIIEDRYNNGAGKSYYE